MMLDLWNKTTKLRASTNDVFVTALLRVKLERGRILTGQAKKESLVEWKSSLCFLIVKQLDDQQGNHVLVAEVLQKVLLHFGKPFQKQTNWKTKKKLFGLNSFQFFS